MTNPYVPLLIMAVFAFAIGVGGLLMSALVGPKNNNSDKLKNYESGIDASPNDYKKLKFNNNFFLIALTFIIFDVELVFLYPWITTWQYFGFGGFFIILIFTFLITIPFIYELKNKTFDI